MTFFAVYQQSEKREGYKLLCQKSTHHTIKKSTFCVDEECQMAMYNVCMVNMVCIMFSYCIKKL